MTIKNALKQSIKVVSLTGLIVSNMGINIIIAEEKSDVFIADREITGLVFQDSGDVGGDTMSPEIAAYIKERTGITLKLEAISTDSSREALVSGLASGDLPDFIGFYLNHSGRPEFPLLLKASNEGMFHDLAPFLKESTNYKKYYEEGYLPRDTKENIMMRDDHEGATYLVHMSIPEKSDIDEGKSIGGMFIRRDIAEALDFKTHDIKTSEELTALLKEIKEGNFKDANGNPVTPLGPTIWGGYDRKYAYSDLIWEGDRAEKFLADEDGTIKHESMTDYAEKRADMVRSWMEEGLMHPEYYTIEENRSKENVINGSYAIVSDITSSNAEIVDENGELKYVPFGVLKRADGNDHEVDPYKWGYSGWAIPSTTENPEDIVKFADWLAGPEGKLLYFYGLEGEHYDLDENGHPIVKEDILKLSEEKPDEAKKLGFRGVGARWGEHLGFTNINNMEQFGEVSWGSRFAEETKQSRAIEEAATLYDFDKRYAEREVVDGLTPRAYLYEFEGDEGELSTALDAWNDEIVKAYYAKTKEESDAIIEQARQALIDAGIEDYCKFLEEKQASGEVIFW